MTNYPAHWKTMMLEEVSAVIDPHPSHRAPAIDPKGIPFVGIGDVREDGIADFRGARLVSPKILSEHSERYSLESDLIGLGRVASVGKVVKLPKGDTPYTISPTLAVISPNEISFDFLYYVLQSPQIQNQLNGLKQGSGRQSVGILKLRKVVVPFPPVDEQHKIVELLEDHLSRLDAALAEVKQAKLKAAQFRRSLLQAAFTGNLSGDGTRLMTVWKTERLANLLAVSIGGIWGEEAGIAEIDVSVVRVTELKAHGRIDPSSAVTRSVSLKQLASRELQEGDLLLEKSGGGPNSPVGRVGYFFQEGTRTVCSNFMQLMRPDSTKVLPKYLFYFLDGFHSTGGTIPMQTATTNIRNIKTPQYMDIDVPVPPLPEQQKIVEILEDHLSRLDASVAIADAMEKQSSSLRRSLLQAAFTGQLTKEVASV